MDILLRGGPGDGHIVPGGGETVLWQACLYEITPAIEHRRGRDLIPPAWHHVERHANNTTEADHSQLKHRLRPMRGLRTDQTTQVIIAGHAFMQNLRRGHYELGLDSQPKLRVASAFSELAQVI